MNIVKTPIKDIYGNVTGGRFTASGGLENSESGVAFQNLSISSAGASYAPFIGATLSVGPVSAQATIMLDVGGGINFSVIKLKDEKDSTRNNAQVSVVISKTGQDAFHKGYFLKELNDKGDLVNTKETGSFIEEGFSVVMPTQIGEFYSASFKDTSGSGYDVQVDMNLPDNAMGTITVTVNSKLSFQDKSIGFTDRELEVIKRTFVGSEGRIEHMYLDKKGYVTVGVGFMIPTQEAALSYPFLNEDGEPASDEQKMAEWRTIAAMEKNHVASWYEDSTELWITNEFMNEKLDSLIDESFVDLKKVFPDLGVYPSPARVALQDMMYNLGLTKFKKFTNLIAAVKKLDWVLAASESHRLDIPDDRNDAVRDLLLKAAESDDI